MDWINLFTAFDGRITRQPFWIGVVILSVLEAIPPLITSHYDADRISSIVDLILTYPGFAIGAKRAHDRDIPTWVIALFFAGSVAFDLLVLAGVINDATQAAAPLVITILLWGVFGLVLMADLGFRRGTEGPNRYGPDPLA